MQSDFVLLYHPFPFSSSTTSAQFSRQGKRREKGDQGKGERRKYFRISKPEITKGKNIYFFRNLIIVLHYSCEATDLVKCKRTELLLKMFLSKILIQMSEVSWCKLTVVFKKNTSQYEVRIRVLVVHSFIFVQISQVRFME